jgi:hypothetical protein
MPSTSILVAGLTADPLGTRSLLGNALVVWTRLIQAMVNPRAVAQKPCDKAIGATPILV